MPIETRPINAFGAPARAMLCLCLLIFSAPLHPSEDAEELLVVDARSLLELAGFDEGQLAELRAGQVVVGEPAGDIPLDVNEFDVFSGFGIVIKADTATVANVLGRAEWAGAGIPGAVALFIEGESEFPPVTFDDGDSEEVSRILAGDDKVNLSKAELRALNNLGLTSRYDSNELARFNAGFREMLRVRYENYLKRGPDSIPPYQDGRDSWSPAEHFRQVNSYWNAWLPKVIPEYANELSLAPGEIDPVVYQEFLLVRKTVGDRPIYSLAHRFGRVTDNVIAAVHREFFVAGAYFATQIVFLGVPYEGGTLLLLGNDTFTEQVAGFGSGLKHGVGRDVLDDVMRGMLMELRAQAELIALTN
jgi:hypothetical protein